MFEDYLPALGGVGMYMVDRIGKVESGLCAVGVGQLANVNTSPFQRRRDVTQYQRDVLCLHD